MQLQEVVPVEDPLEPTGHRAGDLLDGDLGDEVQLDLGASLGNLLAEQHHPLRRRERLHRVRVEVLNEAAQVVETVLGDHTETRADDARLDLGVQQHCDQRVLEARHNEQLVGERVLVPSQPPHLLVKLGDVRFGQVVDDEDLEGRRPLASVSAGLPEMTRVTVSAICIADS